MVVDLRRYREGQIFEIVDLKVQPRKFMLLNTKSCSPAGALRVPFEKKVEYINLLRYRFEKREKEA